jgi:hypothetical protein
MMKITKKRLRELIVEECDTLDEEGALQANATAYIMEEVARQLAEASKDLDMFIVVASIIYRKEAGTDNVLNQVRAINGVTRCSPQGPAMPAGPGALIHLVNIKLLRSPGASIQKLVENLLAQLSRLPEVSNIKVKTINQVER